MTKNIIIIIIFLLLFGYIMSYIPSESSIDTYEYVKTLKDDQIKKYFDKKYEIICQSIDQFPQYVNWEMTRVTERNKYGSCGERCCIEFMEVLFEGYKFVKIRPDWLKNPRTNRNLELDGYNDDLQIGIEYNGIQHYVWPNYTSMTHDQFIQQQYRDDLKQQLCKIKQICLIIIPYTVDIKLIPIAIYSQLIDLAEAVKK